MFLLKNIHVKLSNAFSIVLVRPLVMKKKRNWSAKRYFKKCFWTWLLEKGTSRAGCLKNLFCCTCCGDVIFGVRQVCDPIYIFKLLVNKCWLHFAFSVVDRSTMAKKKHQKRTCLYIGRGHDLGPLYLVQRYSRECLKTPKLSDLYIMYFWKTRKLEIGSDCVFKHF